MRMSGDYIARSGGDGNMRAARQFTPIPSGKYRRQWRRWRRIRNSAANGGKRDWRGRRVFVEPDGAGNARSVRRSCQRQESRSKRLIRSVLMVTPEPPYPLNGGGAFRMASLVHYFAQTADVDLVMFSKPEKPRCCRRGWCGRRRLFRCPLHDSRHGGPVFPQCAAGISGHASAHRPAERPWRRNGTGGPGKTLRSWDRGALLVRAVSGANRARLRSDCARSAQY